MSLIDDRYAEAEELASRMSYRPLSPEQSERGVDIVLDLVSENRELRLMLEALLDHTERVQEHVPKSEGWYAVRDGARKALGV